MLAIRIDHVCISEIKMVTCWINKGITFLVNIWPNSITFFLLIGYKTKQSKGQLWIGGSLSARPQCYHCGRNFSRIVIFNYTCPTQWSCARFRGEVRRKSLNNVAFHEAVKLLRFNPALSVWLFSMCLYCKVWTQSRRVDSLFSLPHRQVTAKNKETLLSCSLCTLPLVSVSFYTFLFLTALRWVRAQSTYFCNKQKTLWIFTALMGILPTRELFSSPPFSLRGEKGCTLARQGAMPLLVGGEWRTAGVWETNQLDSILQALAAFLTTVF